MTRKTGSGNSSAHSPTRHGRPKWAARSPPTRVTHPPHRVPRHRARGPMAAHFRGHRRNAPRATACGGSWAGSSSSACWLSRGASRPSPHTSFPVSGRSSSPHRPLPGPSVRRRAPRAAGIARARRPVRPDTSTTVDVTCPAAGWQAQCLRYQRESNDRLQRQHRQCQWCFQHGGDHRTLRTHQRVWRPKRDHRRRRRCRRRLRLQQQGHLPLGHAANQQCR